MRSETHKCEFYQKTSLGSRNQLKIKMIRSFNFDDNDFKEAFDELFRNTKGQKLKCNSLRTCSESQNHMTWQTKLIIYESSVRNRIKKSQYNLNFLTTSLLGAVAVEGKFLGRSFCLYLIGTLHATTDHGELVPEGGRLAF